MSILGVDTSTVFSTGYTAGTRNQVAGVSQSQENTSLQALQDKLGDTVTISDEGRAMLAAKMREYSGKDPSSLTSEEKDDIRSTFQQALGLSDEQMATLDQEAAKSQEASGSSTEQDAAQGQQGTDSSAQGSGQAQSSGQSQGSGQAQGSGGQGSSGSSDSSDEQDTLEEKIKDMEKEIETLMAKSVNDPEAKEQLAAKRAELANLEAQLAQLESGTS